MKYPVGKTYEYHLHMVRYKVKLNDDVRDIEFTTLIFLGSQNRLSWGVL